MQGSNLGFGKAEDKKHLLEFTIPTGYIASGTLFFEVRIETQRGGVETLSAGIDDFILEAYYECRGLSRRALEENTGEVATKNGVTILEEPGEAEPYCKADDFPCSNGDNMVFICHQSESRGRKTLCIPEMNSKILRDYVHDYCGPCVAFKTNTT